MKNKLVINISNLSLNITVLTIILTLYFPFLNFAQSQNIRFEHLTSEKGLSHSYVRCILQDNQGFMWFGTFDGLNKYNGYNFRVYRHNYKDPGSITANIIYSLYEDSRGNLWIGTAEGLCLYDRDRDVFINYNKKNGYNLGSSDIRAIFEDSQGNLWIGTYEDGLFLFDFKNDELIRYWHNEYDPDSLGSIVRDIFEDSRGNLWIATDGHGLNVFNCHTKTFTHYKHHENDPNSLIGNDVYSIVEDIDGYLWFGCYKDGLSCTHVNESDKHTFINYQHDPENSQSLCSNLISSLCADRNGGLWIGTEDGGVDFFQNDKKTFIHYVKNESNPNGLNNNSIYSLYQDKTGDLWIGTYAGGVNLIDYTKQAFKHYKNLPGNPNSLSYNYVMEFHEDHEGNIWIATDGGGLNKFDTKTGNFEHYNSKNSNLNKDVLPTVYIDSQNNIWIGTWAGGLSLFNRRTKSFLTFTSENSGLSNNNVFDITEDRNGNLWIATQNGLNKFNKKDRSFIVYTEENSNLIFNQIEVIKEDNKSNILIGSFQGLSIFNPKTEEFVNYTHDPKNENSISNDFVTSIFEEDSSTLWIATTNGLNKLNRKTKKITRYFKTDGLPNDLIFGIEKDDKGFLWISTNEGLSRFEPKTETFKNYTKEDGLQGSTFIKKSHHKSKDGKIYFGGVNGFNVFDPNDVIDNTAIPPVVLTDFKIFNKPVVIGKNKSPLQKHISVTDELILSYKHSVFSFEFAALDYTSPAKNQYAFMLESFDKEWNYVENKREATYTNLNPGTYIFKVKGSNNDNVWNEEETSLKIVITPPFWMTLWFRISMIILIIMAVYTIHEVRVRNIVEYGRKLEIEVAERTQDLENFVYIVSHDLKAPLRGINLLAGWTSEDYYDVLDKKGKENLAMLRKRTIRVNDMIQGILEYSRIGRTEDKAHKIDLNKVLKDVIDSLAPPPNIKITVKDKLPEYVADRNHLTQVFQNLLSNAIKYIDKPKGIIKIGCTEEKDEWKFYISDNGPGIEKKYWEKIFKIFQTLESKKTYERIGLGLAIVKKIIKFYKGRIWLESKIKKGTTFYFTLPKQ